LATTENLFLKSKTIAEIAIDTMQQQQQQAASKTDFNDIVSVVWIIAFVCV